MGTSVPSPDSPQAIEFVFGAGMVDPRPNRPRLPMILKQAWSAQAKLYWELGLRFHPELAVKHLRGGGSFTIADILDGPPPEPEPQLTDEQIAERMIDIVAQKRPEFAEKIRQLKENGSDEEKANALRALDNERAGMQALMDFIGNSDSS